MTNKDNKAKTTRMVFLTPEDFNLIVNFLSGLNIPFLQAHEALNAKAAIERAKYIDLKEEAEK